MKFIDREVEYPNRIRLKEVRKEQNGDVIYDLLREEGDITTPGTPLNAENLNALVKTTGDQSISGIKNFTEIGRAHV